MRPHPTAHRPGTDEPGRSAGHPVCAAYVFLVALASALLLAACPEISVDPAQGPQGAEHMVLAVAGTNTNFQQGTTTASFSRNGGGTGIVVEQVQVDSQTSLRLTVSIPADELAGPQMLTVTTGSEVAQAIFAVTQGPAISIQPAAAEQGSIITVSVHGTHTTFDPATFDVDVQLGLWHGAQQRGKAVGGYGGNLEHRCLLLETCLSIFSWGRWPRKP